MTLPDKTDIIVIGAGVMGASIAFNLAKSSDKRVLVLDQHGPLGGMSGRTFGQVRMHYSNALTLEMAHFGMKYVANWEAEVGVGASGYVPMGYLLIVVENQLAPCERNIELASSLGIETRMVTPAEIAEIEPTINASGLSGGAWDPAGGYIDINRMTLGWLEAARGAGDVSLAKARVTGLETTNGAITGVVTDQRAIAAE
ncbi:MAG: FAD-dependent oxidoreductase, partial [Paracoccaceae bacterium]|nr:FAD-dependent oxidoreductase [Paracoccaceae bacterium]